jgi:hypothetical protein
VSVLSVAQGIARRVSEDPPSSIFASDDSAAILLEIIEEAAEEIVRGHPWQALRKEHTWSATATEEQTSAFPSDFGRMMKATFWNRTEQREVLGPYDAAEWQRLKATVSSAVYDQYTVRDGSMFIDPTPTAGHTFAYEYVAGQWWQSAANVAKDAITLDTDSFILNEELLRLFGTYLFRLHKGLDYQRDEARARAFAVQLAAQEKGGARILDLTGGRLVDVVRPGGASPEGNWNL